METTFTIDLSKFYSADNRTSSLTDADNARMNRVHARLTEIMPPDAVVSIENIDGEVIGTVGSEIRHLNIDEDERIFTGYNSDVDSCSTLEQLEQFEEDLLLFEAILNRITHVIPREYTWQPENPVDAQREWVKDQRDSIPARRQELTEGAGEGVTGECNGTLDRAGGFIRHDGPYCPIHSDQPEF